jgi:hypothetical protein
LSLLDLHVERDGDWVVLVPVGRLDLSTYPRLRDDLLKHAAEQPSVLIVDLGPGFGIGTPTVASVFATVWMRVSAWPCLPFMLVASPVHRRVLASQGICRFVPCFHDLDAAVAAAARAPERLRDEVQLPAAATAAYLARDFTRQACGRWTTPEITAQAVLLTSELVENTLKHTDSAPTLRLELFPTQLTVAVRDDHPDLVHRARGDGLTIVDRLSAAWGSYPTLSGGKVVWASIAVPR